MPINSRLTDPEPPHRREPVGTFVKPGRDGELVERIAWSPSDAVALSFDGWQPKTDAPAPAPAESADVAAPPRESPRSHRSSHHSTGQEPGSAVNQRIHQVPMTGAPAQPIRSPVHDGYRH